MVGREENTGVKPAEKVRFSFSTAQWVILTLFLTLLGIVIGFNLSRQRTGILRNEEAHLLLQTRIVQQITDGSLISIDQVLTDLINHLSEGETADGLSHRLGILVDALPGIRTLTVFNGRGDVRASNRKELIGKNFSGREYFSTVMEKPDPEMLYVSRPFITSLGVFAMNVTRMVQGPRGEFNGLVTATLDTAFFIPLMDSILYAPDMRATLAHGSGTLFIMHPDKGNLAGTDLKVPGSFFSRHLESGEEAGIYWGMSAATGLKRVLAARTISPKGLKLSHPLEITVGRDPDAILGEWKQNAVLYGVLYGFVATASVLGTAFFQRRQKRQQKQLDAAYQTLSDQARFLGLLTDNIPGMVGYWTAELRCKYANNAYLEWFGRTKKQMLGISMMELMGETLFKKNEPFIRGALRGEGQRFERTLTKANGEIGYTLAEYVPDIVHGKVEGFFVLVSDVTELKTAEMALEAKVQELNVLASSDALTGIANRRQFLAGAAQEIERAKRYHHPLTFLMLDLDHFKQINDTHGHDVGDAVLTETATAISEIVRSTDLTGRLGGEEFGVLLVQTGPDAAIQTAERLRQELKRICIPSKGEIVRVTVSIGVAIYSGEDDNLERLMKRADDALYQAKDMGRDRVCGVG